MAQVVKVEFMMKSNLFRRCPLRAARIVEAAAIRQPCYSIPGVPSVRNRIHLARNNVRQHFFAIDRDYIKRHARASRQRQTVCEQRAVARWVNVRDRVCAIGTEFIRIKQTPRSAVQCVTTIKRGEFLVLVTLTKKVTLSSYDDVSRCGGAQQLRQTSMDSCARRHC